MAAVQYFCFVLGDVNFAPELSDLRHRKHMYIIIIHGKQVSEPLLACANEHYVFEEVCVGLPERPMSASASKVNLYHGRVGMCVCGCEYVTVNIHV